MSLRRPAPWLLSIAIGLIYLSFPTRLYYWDGITFAQAIEDAASLTPSLVHPNHLIYNFVGYGFYQLLRALGTDVRAITALQILNSLVSAACAGVLFAILNEMLRSRYLAACLTLLFAFSATWWKFSTDANAYIPSVLFLLISFYLILPDRKPRPLLLGVMFFISMAFHQLAVLMWPVLALGVYLQDGPLTLKRRALNAVYFSAVAFVLIVGAYTYLFYLASGRFDLQRLIHWTASYSSDADTRFNALTNLQYSLRGHVRLFFGGRVNLLKGLVNPFVIVLIACLVGAVVLLLFDALRGLFRMVIGGGLGERQLETRQKTMLLLSLFWTLVYLVFLFFWLPQNTFYRVFYLPALILLLGLGLVSGKRRTSKPRTLAVFVAAVALANFLFLIYPFSHVEKNPPLVFALEMNREWPAGTVIYYGAPNSDQILVRYFNPATQWKLLRPEEITTLSGAWLETTAIDQLSASATGSQWLKANARDDSLKELNDGPYKIRFVQVGR
jgi:hypothetical protein